MHVTLLKKAAATRCKDSMEGLLASFFPIRAASIARRILKIVLAHENIIIA